MASDSADRGTNPDGDGQGGPVKSSHIIEEHIDIGTRRDVVYDQWTQYDDFSSIMKGESGQRRSDRRVGFRSKIGPVRRRWTSEVLERSPGRRIAWRSVEGPKNLGVVSFHDVDRSGSLTRLMVEMEYHPSGFFEVVGNFFRMPRRRVRKDLKLFKHHIELANEASGKGPGPIRRGEGLREDVDERRRPAAGRAHARPRAQGRRPAHERPPARRARREGSR